MINFIDNNLIVYSLCTISGLIITGFYIKYYFYSTPVINTSYSPPTFNISLDQLKEIEIESEKKARDKFAQELQDILDNENLPYQETQDQLDQVFKDYLTEEGYDQYRSELENVDNDFSEIIQDIFDIF
jgi:hypothetical protein